MRFEVKRLLFLLGLFVLAGLAHAQLSTASMFGTVTDPTGAAIPNAEVVITQTDTGFSRTVATKGNGQYRADFLPVGPYRVSVSSPGFAKLDRAGITLTVTEEAKLDLSLKPGSASTTVEVTAEVPLLNVENSTLGRTVSNTEIDNLPLVDRNVYTLLDLTPGVQNNNNAGTGGNGGVINPARLSGTTRQDQRFVGFRRWPGVVLPGRRQQHDRRAQHRQPAAEPRRDSRVRGADEQLFRTVWP